jgi:tetrahydromethanopterin S-methyltransferase subunit G
MIGPHILLTCNGNDEKTFLVIFNKIAESDDAHSDPEGVSNYVANEPEAVAPADKNVYQILLPFNKVCKAFTGLSINRDQGKKITNYFTNDLDAWLKSNSSANVRSSKKLRIFAWVDFADLFADKPLVLSSIAHQIHNFVNESNMTLTKDDSDKITECCSVSPPRKQLSDADADSDVPPAAPIKKSIRQRRRRDDMDDVDDDEVEFDLPPLPRKRALLMEDDLKTVSTRLDMIEKILRALLMEDDLKTVSTRLDMIEKILATLDVDAIRDAHIKANEEEWKAEYNAELNKKILRLLK